MPKEKKETKLKGDVVVSKSGQRLVLDKEGKEVKEEVK